jgi:hypothetical protein
MELDRCAVLRVPTVPSGRDPVSLLNPRLRHILGIRTGDTEWSWAFVDVIEVVHAATEPCTSCDSSGAG